MAFRNAAIFIFTVALLAAAIVGINGIRFAYTNVESPAQIVNLVRITAEKIPMDAHLATLCIAPEVVFGPHAEAAEVHVYANGIALEYRRTHPNEYDYPIGSKFVKEKYSTREREAPTVATVMTRRTASGNVSDWDFAILSLPDWKPLESSRAISCADCHEQFADTGYISAESEAELRRHLRIE